MGAVVCWPRRQNDAAVVRFEAGGSTLRTTGFSTESARAAHHDGNVALGWEKRTQPVRDVGSFGGHTLRRLSNGIGVSVVVGTTNGHSSSC